MKSLVQIGTLIAVLLSARPGAPVTRAKTPPAAPQDASSKAQDSPGQIPATIPKGKKLFLTDGTFQMAREYSVEGDRVRYWSVERSQWEEIPAGLVDWDATHKEEAEQTAKDAELKAKIHASNMARLTKDIDVDRSLEIKPGLFLPDDIGMYALDRDKQVRVMKQSDAIVKMSTAREMEKRLSGVTLIPDKGTMSIPGERAAMRLATAEPEFYFRPVDRREPRFRLVRAQIKGGKRVVDSFNVLITGQESHHGAEIEMQTWTPATGVYRYTMDQRLEPGEYAFVEMTDEGVSGFVWDFGIDLPESKSKH